MAGRQASGASGADGETVAIIAEGIGVVGSTEKGDHVGLELLLAAGDKVSVLFPSILFQKLMAALMAAGSAAHRKQVEWLGSEQAAASHAGAQPFVPTSWSISRASTRERACVCVECALAHLDSGSSLVHCWQNRVTRPEMSVMASARKCSSAGRHAGAGH